MPPQIVLKEDPFEIYEDEGRFTLYIDNEFVGFEYIGAFLTMDAARTYAEDEMSDYLPNLD